MKEVDWGIAPEGATHYNEECRCPWLKETPPSYFVEGGGAWVEYPSDRMENHLKNHFKNAIKRPREWDGSGIPPVGAVCEYLKHAKYRTTWIKVKVVFIGGSLIVFEHGANGNEFSEQITEVSFRLIKTPEQIAAEDRLLAIDEMCNVIRESDLKTVTALYDAGYRKTEVLYV